MHLSFIDTKEEILTLKRKSKHVAPHLHNALEIVCVTNGTLELGVGQELYHMEKGDIGFVFPDIIHHYQIFSPGVNKAVYIISPSFAIGKYAEIIQTMAPDYPIIKAEMVEPEVYRAINAILEYTSHGYSSYTGISADCDCKMHWKARNWVEKGQTWEVKDLVYQAVSYVSGNFRKNFSLDDMARDLGAEQECFITNILQNIPS